MSTGEEAKLLTLNTAAERLSKLGHDFQVPELVDISATLKDVVDTLSKRKGGLAKIFIAIHQDRTIVVQGTVPIHVITARMDKPTTTEMLTMETLSPLPEQEFLETVHDTLAEQIQSGEVSPAEINKTVNYGTSTETQ